MVKKKKKKVEEMLDIARGRKKALIMPHNYADPDAIAAALAVESLLKAKLQIPSIISFSGGVGRNENRVLCECLDVKIRATSEINFDDFDLYVLVDCQPGTGNNSFPKDRTVDIIIDHHPPSGKLEDVSFVEIREDYGSSSTILTEYLKDASVEIDQNLATALFYGIKSDAMNFAIKTKTVDIKAFQYLHNLIDVAKIIQIEGACHPEEYFKVLKVAISEAEIIDDIVVSDLGSLSNPGMLGEFADFFLKMEGINIVICMGVHEENLLISIRSINSEINAGTTIKAAISNLGTGGGHKTMAGAQIPLSLKTKNEENELKLAIMSRTFKQLDIDKQKKRKLA